MKNILLSLGVIALVVAGVAGATVAYFSSSATITASTFKSGTLALKIDADPSPSTYNWQVSFPAPTGFPTGGDNVKPGSHGEQIIDIMNDGTVDGNATIKLDATAWSALGDNLNFTVSYDGDHNGAFETAVASGSLATWNHNTYTLGSLNANSIASVKIVWSVPTSAGNDIQGKSVVIDTTFGLEQTP